MSDSPSTSQPSREQLRRQFLEQAATAFDRLFPAGNPVHLIQPNQRDQRAHELGQQLVSCLLQQSAVSDAGFLQAIFEHPEDDAPRLIYADWLDDNGQPALAEFIRLQCRLAALAPGDAQGDLLRLREEDLLREHGPAWLVPLPIWARKCATFQRGFVNHFTMTPREFLRHDSALRKIQHFDSLRLTDFPGSGDSLVASGLLRGLRHLHLRGGYASQDPHFGACLNTLLTLLRSSALAGLESLELSYCPVTEEVCQALVASEHLGRLQRLALTNAGLRPAQAQVLSHAPLLGQLREFDLSGNSELGAAGIEALAHSPHWGQLQRLSLDHCYLPAEAVRELIAAPMARGLTSLSLICSYSLWETLPSLADQPNLGNLVHLELHGTGVDDEGLEALAHSSHLRRLTSLGLGYDGIGAEGMRALTQGPLLGQLTGLRLCGSKPGPAGWRTLGGSPACRKLCSLDLGSCEIGPDDLAVLAASPHLSSLAWLNLDSNLFGVSGAQALAASTTLPALRYLQASYNRLGGEGARALTDSPLMNRLQRLVLRTNGVNNALRRELQARFGQRVQF